MPNTKSVALLSPVGSWDALVAAVSNGADAVYLGSKLFNARRLAGNFNPVELRRAVQYAHLHNVKVFLTLNTLVKNSEIKAFLQQISIAASLGIDAVILQDLSFAPIVKKNFPKMKVHASTQSTLMNTESVKYWMKYVDVFVLARELNKEDVRKIFDNTGAHLEMFVHGHLCISYSGQCLISSLIGKRSGNRGMCASSCRKKYNGDEYLLSAKDLSMIENMKEVIDSGVKTIKMEGRMKSAEYVATVTREYRKQLDAALAGTELPVTKERLDDLRMAFNRNFTKGYFAGEEKIVDPFLSSKRGLYLGKVVTGYLRLLEDLDQFDGVVCIYNGEREGDFVKKMFDRNNVSIDSAKAGESVKLNIPGFSNGAHIYLLSRHGGRNLLGSTGKLACLVDVKVKEGSKPKLTVSLMDTVYTFDLDVVAAKPSKHEFKSENWVTELLKFESTIFSFDAVNITVDTDGSFVPKSLITEFRSSLDQALLNLLVPLNSGVADIKVPSFAEEKSTHTAKIHVQVYTKKDAILALEAGCDYLYYDLFSSGAAEIFDDLRQLAKPNQKICAFTPMVLKDEDVENVFALVKELRPESLLVQNVGLLNLDLKIPVVLGYQMNVFNDHQLSSYLNHAGSTVSRAVASIELNADEISKFSRKNRLLYYAHGRPIVMTFNERVAKTQLEDEMEYRFPLRRGATGSTQMLYSNTVGLLQHTPEILKFGVDGLFLDLEKNSDIRGLVKLYKDFADGNVPQVQRFKRAVTLGNFEKGVM